MESMLVGKGMGASDNSGSMRGLMSRDLGRATYGIGDLGIPEDVSSIWDQMAVTNLPGESPGTINPTIGVPTNTGSGFNWAGLTNLISAAGSGVARGIAVSSTGCGVGTAPIGGQCLPISAINYAQLTNMPLGTSSFASSLGASSSYMPLILGAGALLVVMMMMKGK